MQLILASTSRYRRELLARLGVQFECHAPRVDEDSLKDPALDPAELAQLLARTKARSLAEAFPDAAILGSDQVCACGGRIYSKPGNFERAAGQLAALAGRTHRLLTAVALAHPGGETTMLDTTSLQMRSLSSAEIERYLTADQPFDCAGSYAIERRGIALFERIESADQTAITGLPLLAVARLLREVGFEIP